MPPTIPPADALANLRNACVRSPRDGQAWLQLGVEADRLGLHRDAIAAAERLLALAPIHNDVARLLLGRNLQALGRIDEAAAQYRQLARGGGARAWQAWFSLVDLKTVRLDADERVALEQAARDPRLPDDARAVLDFALGKVLEDAGRYADAFATFARANAQRKRASNWNATTFDHQVEAQKAVFAVPPVGAPDALGGEIVFIVGLPRSSTTLVEQILAAHPDVEGASELHDLPAVLGQEAKRRGSGFPRWALDATPADWQRLGSEYLDRTRRWRASRPRSTDKLPSNWMLIGAIRAMLPAAKIIDCRRDPLETCWSCYKQLFAPGLADYSYDLGDLAAYWHGYDRLMRFWGALHPRHLRLQSYEQLLREPERETRALLEFCALEWNPASLAFHAAERAVRTPSAAQVREPLRGNTMRTPGYGELLEPLRRALGASTRR